MLIDSLQLFKELQSVYEMLLFRSIKTLLILHFFKHGQQGFGFRSEDGLAGLNGRAAYAEVFVLKKCFQHFDPILFAK